MNYNHNNALTICMEHNPSIEASSKLTTDETPQLIWKRLQSKVLSSVSSAACYVSKFTLHSDLQIPFVTEEIHRLSTLYHQSILEQNSTLDTEISKPTKCKKKIEETVAV
jgi:hypothetical protein